MLVSRPEDAAGRRSYSAGRSSSCRAAGSERGSGEHLRKELPGCEPVCRADRADLGRPRWPEQV